MSGSARAGTISREAYARRRTTGSDGTRALLSAPQRSHAFRFTKTCMDAGHPLVTVSRTSFSDKREGRFDARRVAIIAAARSASKKSLPLRAPPPIGICGPQASMTSFLPKKLFLPSGLEVAGAAQQQTRSLKPCVYLQPVHACDSP